MKFEEIGKANEKRILNNRYPGRGIIIGSTPDECSYVQIYWIMGRSANSRNRIFELDGGFMRTKAYDESKMEDPSLIIYYPVKSLGNYHIVSNGDQTDTIYEYIKNGRSFGDALNTREYEPDAPNYTPRISGLISLDTDKARYTLSILKAVNGEGECCQRNYYSYDSFIKGFGHCIHTYDGDGTPIPSFTGEPYIVRLFNNIEETAQHYWSLLNEENRISLMVKYINVQNGKVDYWIINKNH